MRLIRVSFMPRYFFNIFHERAEFDSVGEELPDRHAAWKEATITAGQLLQSLDGKLQPGRDWQMEVTDEFANPFEATKLSSPRCCAAWNAARCRPTRIFTVPAGHWRGPALRPCRLPMLLGGHEVRAGKPDFLTFRCERYGCSEKFVCEDDAAD